MARETANLLYFGIEKEYKQAKLKATKTFGAKILPTNLEVAIELDKIAEENEGETRQKRLIQMRKEALKMMQILKAYRPLLIGSVWRGTIHHESDIDIVVYHDEPNDIINALKQNNLKITQTEWVAVTKKGKRKGAFHIYAESLTREKAEIKVACPEEISRKEKCEIYGDAMVGLRIKELENLLQENASQRFVPF
jgi:predicted nucleotidyltransferase